MITLTPRAIEELKKIMAQESPDEPVALRVGVKGGGCSGLTYFLTLEKEERPGDKVLDFDGVKVLLDSKSAIYLEGTELDFTDGLSGSGFAFHNPKAVRTCGCGSSFAV
jgi:iron-sulfur cluster assembly protein